jgi:GNAT superfamily N-acetyltransferase
MTRMLILRPFMSDDVDALYAISLATADAGADASPLYQDKHLVGAIYSVPYATLDPDLVVMAADEEGVAGFVLGAVDTVSWEARLEQIWWPQLRRRYPAPDPEARGSWTPDQRRMSMIHHPERAPIQVVREFPAHLHLNLLPRHQGRGVGTQLFHAWLRLANGRGASATHVGVNRANARAMAFWSKMGFRSITPPELSGGRTVWMGRN